MSHGHTHIVGADEPKNTVNFQVQAAIYIVWFSRSSPPLDYCLFFHF